MTPRRSPRRRLGQILRATTAGALVFGGVLLNSGCENSDPAFHHRILAFGKLLDISIVELNRRKAKVAAAALEQDFDYMQGTWDARELGPLLRTNRLLAEGKPFAAPPSLLPLLQEAQRLSMASDYLFNPATGRLRRLWGFQAQEPECHEPPGADRIAALVAGNPKPSDIEIDDFHLHTNNSAVQLDFSGIAKGYSFEQAIRRLKELEVRNALLSSEGDMSAIGSRDGRPWRVGIRTPSGGIFAYTDISEQESMFTAGDYKHNFTWEGIVYHDVLDPRTGYPARGSRSVTVIHESAATADAASTALFVAGPSQWHEIAKKMGVRYVMLLDSDGALHMSPAMQARIRLLDDSRKVLVSPPLT